MKDIDYSVDEFYKKYYECYIIWIKRHGFNREDAEDIIQTALINAVKGFDSNSNFKFTTYIHKIILNEMMATGKRNKRNQYYEFKDLEIDNNSDVEYEVMARETMDNLPEIIRLWVEGYTYEEIAEKLNISFYSVRYKLRKYGNIGC